MRLAAQSHRDCRKMTQPRVPKKGNGYYNDQAMHELGRVIRPSKEKKKRMEGRSCHDTKQ